MSAHIIDCVDDDYNAHVDLRKVCRGCGRLSRNLAQGDGWCARCNGDEPSYDELIRRDMAAARERTRQTEIRALRRAKGEVF